ncbi:MAG: membrane protein insertion efficiency factor YidD [Burkholderiaceae bacterium]|nr:MAG: membrane protein insertion efficiency factor YidD [Burkholderiaceae bacterium]
MKTLLLALIRAYRWLLSPWLGNRCRFFPSCSEYASEALQQHGVWHGGGLALRRLLRCHPWHAGGYDPVPPLSCGCHPVQAQCPSPEKNLQKFR